MSTADLTAGASAPIRIQLLGGFSVQPGSSEGVVEQWRLTRARSLVALLALGPGHRRHREEIIDLLWPEVDPAAGSSNLRYALHVARRTLGKLSGEAAELIVRNGEFLEFAGSIPVQVDVDLFERACAEALESGDYPRVQNAIALYSGVLLPEDRYEDWVLVQRERLRGQHLLLLDTASTLAESAGDRQAAIDWSLRLLNEDRLDEDAHYRLMCLYTQLGRRSDALRQFRTLESALRDGLDVEPGADARQLYADILAYRVGQVAQPDGAGTPESGEAEARHALPRYLTSFIGRQADLAAVSSMLEVQRMVTLTGLGGVGKTRLALEVVDLVEERFTDGIYVVDLSSIQDARQVWPAVLSVVELSTDHVLADAAAVASLDALVLIDNCEHLNDAAGSAISALLAAGSNLRILATSREILRIAGEAVWSVAPLSLPEVRGRSSLDDLRQSEAALLFVDRLRLRQPQTELTEEIAQYVLDICRQLDGLPLALEMAAARVASISLPDLAARLTNAPAVLSSSNRETPERHETLRAMLDWSYQLLNQPQQEVFTRLSVFPGSWSLDQAELVALDEDIHEIDVLDTLAELVDKSLVVRDGDVMAVSYRYLAPVRQYAARRLAESGSEAVIRRRHGEAFLALAETAALHLRGPQQSHWMAILERNRDNLRNSISWALESDPMLALRLTVALGRFWYVSGYLREGREAFAAALKAAPEGSSELQAQALFRAGILADEAGEETTARDLLQRSLSLFKECGQPADIASVLNSLGVVAWEGNDLQQARSLLRESLAIRRTLGDPKVIASTLGNLALIEWSSGDLEAARVQQEESVALARESGDEWSVAIGMSHLGRIAWEQADYRQARVRFSESLSLAQLVGDRGLVAEGLEGLAGVLGAQRQGLQAARLWGAAEALRESLAVPISAPELPSYSRMVEVGMSGVDQGAFEAAWEEGRGLQPDTVVQEILAAITLGHTHDPARDDRKLLTSRQREITELIAQNMTNQQIAELLGIAPRTVDTHVSNILQTLGCRSRAEVIQLLSS